MNKKVISSAKKLKRKNKKLYYVLVATVCIIVLAVAICAYIRPDLFDFLNTNTDNSINTNTNTSISTINGTVIYDTTLSLDSGLRVHFIDVGQGDAIYIEFPNGKDMLIDGGSTTSTKNNKVFIDGTPIQGKNAEIVSEYVAKYNDDEDIDYLMITHPDSDHYNYLSAVFERYQVNNVYLPYAQIDDYSSTLATSEQVEMFEGGKVIKTLGYKNIVKTAFDEPDCEINCTVGNFEINIEENISFKVYSFDKEEYSLYNVKSNNNELSPICLLEYANRRVVLTGDAEFKSEQDYLKDSPTLDCDVLKAGHHGSSTSSSEQFLDDITCEYVIISAGITNYGHPHEETLNKYKARNMQYFCTITYGTIVLIVDDFGKMVFVSSINVEVG